MRSNQHHIARGASVAARSLVGLSLLAGLAALSGCGPSGEANAQSEGPGEKPRNVRVLQVAPLDMPEYLSLSGTVRAVRGTNLSAEEGGSVEAIPKDKGSRVRAGDVLMFQDRRLLAAEVQSTAAARDLSAFNRDRVKQLYEANSASEIELREAEAQLQQADALASIARIRHDRAAIRAPFDGVVSDRFVEIGELVSPGMPVLRVVNPYVLKLVSSVTERDIGWIRQGTEAQVSFSGIDEEFSGYVHYAGFEANPMNGKFEVEIRIDNPELKVYPGVIGRARVLKAVHRQVISIPRDAVVPHGGGATAFVVEGEVVRRRELRLGADQGLMVIVEDGLKPGDRLVVRGQRDVLDGSNVVVQEESTRPDGSAPTDPDEITAASAKGAGWKSGDDGGGNSR